MISVLPIRECGDACQAGELAFGPPPACPQTEPRYRLRLGVYRRLIRVQQTLLNGGRLRLYEGTAKPGGSRSLVSARD
jgi:hypothetical protein